MKYVGNKEENIVYKKRPGAYAIIINKDDDKIGIVATEGRYFYLGGGIEKGETKLETLKRELLEESGYTIKNIKEFSKFEEKGFFDYGGSTIVQIIKKDNVEIDNEIMNMSADDIETKVKIGMIIGKKRKII